MYRLFCHNDKIDDKMTEMSSYVEKNHEKKEVMLPRMENLLDK